MAGSRSLRWLFVAAALTLASAPAFGAEWHRQTVTPDGFSIEFSGDVAVKPTQLDADVQDAIVRSTIYAQSSDSYVFIVAATLVKGPFNFTAGVDGTMRSYACTQADSDVPGTQDDGTQTRTIRAHHCSNDWRVACNFFMRGPWFYQVITGIGPDADPRDAEHFLNSFQMLPTASE